MNVEHISNIQNILSSDCPFHTQGAYAPTFQVYITRKMVPITGRASSFLEEKKDFDIKFELNSFLFFSLLSFSVSRANLSCVVATIFSSLAFLSTSIFMANLSGLLAATYSRYRDAVHRYGDAVHRYWDAVHRYKDAVHSYRDVSVQLIFITSLQYFESGLALILVVFSVTDDLFFFL